MWLVRERLGLWWVDVDGAGGQCRGLYGSCLGCPAFWYVRHLIVTKLSSHLAHQDTLSVTSSPLAREVFYYQQSLGWPAPQVAVMVF